MIMMPGSDSADLLLRTCQKPHPKITAAVLRMVQHKTRTEDMALRRNVLIDFYTKVSVQSSCGIRWANA